MKVNAPEILKSKTVLELPRGENNPRNSEGDFAVLKDGSILFAYCCYHGDSAHDDADCDIAGCISYDNGETFEKLPYKLACASEHGVKNIMSVSLERLKDGTLCLFYLCKVGPQSEVYFRRALDDEKHFGEAEIFFSKKDGIYYVINNCRVCVLENGKVLIPAAIHKIVKHDDGRESGEYYGTCRVFSGDEKLKEMKELSDVLSLHNRGYSGTGLQEPGIVELPDGRLYMYYRTDRCFQYESFSSDDGATWTEPVQSRFTSPDSPMLIMRNKYSGIYYAVWNPVPNYNGRLDPNGRWVNAGRTPFVIAQSENGIDFSQYTVLEDDKECGYCYPAIEFLNENEMLISYCCGGPDDGMCLTKTRIRKIFLDKIK